jgi:signal transduction histidine kinase
LENKIPAKFEITTDFVDTELTVSVDQKQIKQVFTNLITNALQAMPDGGKLEIKTSRQDKFVNIEFKDNGVGIAPDNMGKIFEPLFTTKINGFGFGLTYCHDVVIAHHGDISVKSTPRQGTTFTIILPCL